MEKEKKFHATEYKPNKFICKVQINGKRKSFYGNTEEEAISKAKLWYEDNVKVSDIDSSIKPIDNDKILEQLNRIGDLLEAPSISQNSDDIYITVKEAQEYLRISQGQMYSLINQPDFPRQKIGRTYRIHLGEFKDYMKRHRFSQINI